MTCPLCEISQGKNIKTKIYYPPQCWLGNADWTLVNCPDCNTMMAVFHKHISTLKVTELRRLLYIMEVRWPRDKWDCDIRLEPPASCRYDSNHHVCFHILNLRKVK